MQVTPGSLQYARHGAAEPSTLPRAAVSASRNSSGEKTSAPASSWRHYALALATFVVVSTLNLWLQQWIGYQAIALVYLLSVVLLALFINRGAILFGTMLTAGGWNYFFAPPAFAFNISDTYDNMMLITYFVVTLTVGQLTTRLRAQRDAEMHAKVVAESERLGRTLLNSVSHELRTPIAAIASAAQSLQTSGSLTGDQKNLMSEIETAGARLNRVVQSLLNAARLQSGHIKPRLDWCDISDLVRVAVSGVKPFTAAHPVRTNIAAGVPLVMGDFVLLDQALANLIVNAAVHTPPGTPIEISSRLEGAFVVLEVADRGSGIPKDSARRIFEPFYRSASAPAGGTGLGLAIVKGFVEAQGGSVSVANRPGGGAVFSILLPASERPEEVPD
jgi:two-component system sensor histidine kinase KdpD